MNLVFRRVLVAAWIFVLEGIVLTALFPKLASGQEFTVAIRPFLLALVALSMVQGIVALYRPNSSGRKTD